MISFKQACDILDKKFPEATRTDYAFKYEGSYYVVLSDSDTDSLVIDGMFKVDGKTGEVSKYSPTLDENMDITKIEFME